MSCNQRFTTTAFSVSVVCSWILRPNIPNASVEVPGQTLHCHDGNNDSKGRGLELCAHVLQGWCHNSRIIDSHCSPVLEANVEGVHIVPEDFNQVCLKSVLSKFYQHCSVLPEETGHWTICTVTSSIGKFDVICCPVGHLSPLSAPHSSSSGTTHCKM